MDDRKKKIIIITAVVLAVVSLILILAAVFSKQKGNSQSVKEPVDSAKEQPIPTPENLYGITGIITEVDIQGRIISLETQDLSLDYYSTKGAHPLTVMTIKVNADTEIIRLGKKSSLGEFKAGDGVSVSALEDIKRKKEFIAKKITYLPPIE